MTRKRSFILIALLLLAAAFITILNYPREVKVDKRELMRGAWRSTGAGPELSITKDSDSY